MQFTRRSLIAGAGALSAVPMTGMARAAIEEARDLKPVALPPAIAPAERLTRIAKAQRLMRANGIGAVIVESGPSLDYFTGVRWWRSERLTAVVIPSSGDAIIVTPFFEKPSVGESLTIPAEIRTWDEDEDPLRLVAGFLRERNIAGGPVGIEETNRYFIVDRLRASLPSLRMVSANPVVRACRMVKSPTEISLMQAASDITLAAFRHAWPRVKAGMTRGDIDGLIGAATRALGGEYDGGLVLLGEATAYPHGSGKRHVIERGTNVLFDCGCSVHGYQSDISRSFVWGADPTKEQRKVWDQVARGQKIAFAAARVGRTAGSVDDAVRAAYTAWGYGPGYKLPGLSHRTGHGIGMEGHEPVNLVHGETTPLAPGMCFSNEPGIYLPGKFGIRLEDCFRVTASGPRWFSVPPASLEEPFGRSGA
ncbi:aminopeptidase P family protein [Sphingomonas rhizophila]|uniref:Aminopeptidase P family protein n=1 Tax=Sphingomonas rhizophila TaxID=2071607 RepID=A0A7G9SDM0_9SPHN|nr:Xaa-Pro peptidase family protein [Sphingomonas rhizophila]QNN65945.1 aminopeptidase P family protein [Sphingomonas rhizophila]